MKDKIFIDTNILIYAHDIQAVHKHKIAKERLQELWENQRGVISIQVLQEFYVNVTRKIPVPISALNAREIIKSFQTWQVEVPGIHSVLRASEIAEKYQLSFWDGLIVATAENAAVGVILSEDLSHGQLIAGIKIENPFLQ